MTFRNVAVEPKTGKKIYSQEEAFQSSVEYFKGDDLAARVWVNKYALKDSFGNIYEKNPDEMHRRLASEIARIEKKESQPNDGGGSLSVAERFQIHCAPGWANDRNRKRFPDCIAIKLFCDWKRRQFGLVRRYYEN